MSPRDYVCLAFYCDYCGVQDRLAICLLQYFLSYIDTAWNFFVYLFLSILLVKSEKFLTTPCITIHLHLGSFFLSIWYKYKPWQNAVLGMDKLPYTALLMQ